MCLMSHVTHRCIYTFPFTLPVQHKISAFLASSSRQNVSYQNMIRLTFNWFWLFGFLTYFKFLNVCVCNRNVCEMKPYRFGDSDIWLVFFIFFFLVGLRRPFDLLINARAKNNWILFFPFARKQWNSNGNTYEEKKKDVKHVLKLCYFFPSFFLSKL